MSKRLSIFLVGMVIFLTAHNSGWAQTNDWSHRISSGTKNWLTSWMGMCSNPIHVLKVDGKRFENVRGEKPFYLRVPNANAIVFAVDEKDNSITLHYYNMDTKEDVAMHSSNMVLWGRNIGLPETEWYKDAVDVAPDGEIILINKWIASEVKIKNCVYLDVSKKEITAIKRYCYDKAGNLTSERDEPPQN